MPYDGFEVDGSVFDESEFLDYCADIVQDVYVKAAAFGFMQPPPATLMSRDEALYCLRQVSSFLGGRVNEPKREPSQPLEMTLDEAAAYLRMTPSNLYKIVGRSRKQKHPEIEFHQSKPKAKITFRREWLDAYITRSPDIKPVESKRQPPKSIPRQVIQSRHGFDPSLLD